MNVQLMYHIRTVRLCIETKFFDFHRSKKRHAIYLTNVKLMLITLILIKQWCYEEL